MTLKELLLNQTHLAYHADEEMSLKASLWKVTEDMASQRLTEGTPTIAQIVHHVAHWKIEYCRQGFSRWQGPIPPATGKLQDAIALLERAQAHLLECLESCSDADLANPVPIQFHGRSAAHFFTVMLIHDVSHASHIRSRRRLAQRKEPSQ
ncbi:MAG: DinB family protein [Phycisphaeraceae bacterium]|nr:DinB family protein [Phycisphaeraceae bacterium]